MLLDDGLRALSECRITTTGRATGQARSVDLWFAAVDDRVFVLAGGRDGAHWVRNLQADPRASVRIRDRTFEGTARFVEGTADDPIAREAIAAKYGRGGLTEWLRESLPVAIDLVEELGSDRPAR
jgi:deazaflavin-dependent oxidoreductase (nitroreductase family)